jgi:hypothetical protein
MRKLFIITMSLICLSISAQTKQVFSPHNALIITSVEAFEVGPCTIYTNQDVTVNLYADEVTKNDAVTKLNAATFPALPSSGTIHEGKYYSYSGTIVKCLQTHERTGFTPAQTPALFALYRVNDGTLAWVENEQILVGWKRTYNSKVYICIQAHTSVNSLTPDKTPALWNAAQTSQEWAVGVAYKIGDVVTYSGKSYQCLQAHTSISTWYPSAVPSLWKLQ